MEGVQNKEGTVRHDEISLKELILKMQDWFKYLFSKWYILLIAGFIGGGIGFIYAMCKKPMYIATTTFVLESGDKGGSLGQYAGMAAMVGIDLGGSSGGIFQGDNLLNLYRSRKMIEAALLQSSVSDSSKLLIDRFFEINNTRNIWREKAPTLLKIDFKKKDLGSLQRSRDSIVYNVVALINKNNLEVGTLDKKSSIIKAEVKSEDEVFSKEFNEAIVNEVNSFYIQTKTKKSLNNIDILQHKTDSVRAVMNGSISAAASVFDATPNLNPTRQAQRVVPTQRSQFSAETNKAILGQLVQNLEMSKLTLMKESPLIEKLDEPIFPLKKEVASKIKFCLLFCFVFIFLSTCFLSVRYILKDIGVLKRN